MLTFSTTKKQDLEHLAKIYASAFNTMGEKRTNESALPMVKYWYPKKIKITVMLDQKIIGACFADIKPLYFGNIIFDGDLFVDPKYQNKGYGRQILLYVLQYAQKKYKTVGRDFFTFKTGFQNKRYKKIGFNTNEKRCMLTGNTDEIIQNLIKNK